MHAAAGSEEDFREETLPSGGGQLLLKGRTAQKSTPQEAGRERRGWETAAPMPLGSGRAEATVPVNVPPLGSRPLAEAIKLKWSH